TIAKPKPAASPSMLRWAVAAPIFQVQVLAFVAGAFGGDSQSTVTRQACHDFLKEVESRFPGDDELALVCRARLTPGECDAVLTSLGRRPGGRDWNPERLESTCEGHEATFVKRQLLDPASLDPAAWGRLARLGQAGELPVSPSYPNAPPALHLLLDATLTTKTSTTQTTQTRTTQTRTTTTLTTITLTTTTLTGLEG
ncbi:unnamed protein product, partial [Polarella glacialis]